MILRHTSAFRHHGTLPGAATAVPAAWVPNWLRRAVPGARSLDGQDIEDIAVTAGVALGAIDAVVRREERWAGVWRQRLALSAAALAAKQAGRVEDEAALRDAVLLARPGDGVGPAGLLFTAWRRLADRPAAELLTKKNLAALSEEFGYAHDDEAESDLADDLRRLGAGAGMVAMLTGALVAAERRGFGRAAGCWLADALLAQRLGWPHAVPLLGAEAALGFKPARSGRATAAGIGDEADRAKELLAAQARAAVRAIDLFAELGRRADKLLAVAPKLRARGADAIVDRLLNEDALVASRGNQKARMSDRGLRRLFDRLVEFDAVRELSGRPAFRIYGL